MAPNGIVFLMYHELRCPGRAVCREERGYLAYVIGVEDFRAQLERLRSAGLAGMNVSQALAATNSSRPGVAITFDDGCETDLVAAAPLLKEAGFNATFYVVTGFVGRPGYMAARQLRELVDLGFEIGCHSMTHAYLNDLDEPRLRVEVVEAKEKLEQHLGRPVDHFSCPGGRWSGQVARLAQKAGYVSVATSRTGANGPASDHFNLARIAVQRGLRLAAFENVCRRRWLWLRRTRYRVLAAAKGLLGNGVYERIRATLLGSGEGAPSACSNPFV
jgi:peptidoglycan/xylan/chitin deacetylase (PgdA/CDA1 family)